MVISHQRRNPFKRNSASGSSTPAAKVSSSNPLSHLTEKAIGFEIKKSSQQINNETPSTPAEFDDGAGPSGLSNGKTTATEPNSIAETMDPGESQESEVIPSSINNENKARNEVSGKLNCNSSWSGFTET